MRGFRPTKDQLIARGWARRHAWGPRKLDFPPYMPERGLMPTGTDDASPASVGVMPEPGHAAISMRGAVSVRRGAIIELPRGVRSEPR